MADDCGEHEKPITLTGVTTATTTSSGTPSPRGVHGIGSTSSSSNDANSGCVVASGSTGIATIASAGDVTSAVNDSTATTTSATPMTTTTTTAAGTTTTTTTRSTPASVGLVAPAASSTSATSASGGSPSTWTSTSDVTTVGAISAPGGAATVAPGHGGSRKNGSSPRSPKHLLPRKSRVRLSELQLESATREEWAAKWREQDLYIECLEAQAAAQEGELACLRDSEEKYKQQCFEVSHRERILVRRLASKEQQLLAYINQITELKASQTPSASTLRSALLDPAVNILIQKLRQELQSTKAKLEDTQNELSAWKFTPDSNTGKRLMAKCRLLYQENEELGRMIASGRIAKLEGELMLQKSFSEEVKKSQSELDEFLQDLDEDVEGMQSTIYFLQQELRKARESVSLLQQENNAFKSTSLLGTSPSALQTPPAQQQLSSSPQPPTCAAATIDTNNVLSNGVTSLSHGALVPKVPSSTSPDDDADDDDDDEDIARRSPSDVKSSVPVKPEVNVDCERDSFLEDGGKRAPLQASTLATSSFLPSSASYDATKSESPGRRRLDEPDESSNDSAALIIKVENEELSDREEEDEVPVAAPVTSESRAPPPKQLRRTIRERTTIKNEGGGATIAGGRSNGDDRNSSRGGSRRLLRERTNKRDKSAVDSEDERPPSHKKKRRESILSLDYTETDDDALLLTNGESIQSDPEDGP